MEISSQLLNRILEFIRTAPAPAGILLNDVVMIEVSATSRGRSFFHQGPDPEELEGKLDFREWLKKTDTLVSTLLAELDALASDIAETLNHEDGVFVKGFGLFFADRLEQVNGKNPRTGEPIQIPGKTFILFFAHPDLENICKAVFLPRQLRGRGIEKLNALVAKHFA